MHDIGFDFSLVLFFGIFIVAFLLMVFTKNK